MACAFFILIFSLVTVGAQKEMNVLKHRMENRPLICSSIDLINTLIDAEVTNDRSSEHVYCRSKLTTLLSPL